MKISLEEAKNYLKVEHSEDDHLIQVMISASEELYPTQESGGSDGGERS